MRPHISARASSTLGVLCCAITLAALASPAQAAEPPIPSNAAQGGSIGARVANASAQGGQIGARVAQIVTAHRRLNVLTGSRARIGGRIRPAIAGRVVELQRRTERGWRTIAYAKTRADGRFRFAFRPRRPSSAQLRVRIDASREPLGRLNVYRRAAVSWYGPGLYGNSLSCGGRLTPGTLGVAHKTLPCGTRLTLRHRGRIVRVRVIDRGPFVGGREYDLTAATRARLRFTGVGIVHVTR